MMSVTPREIWFMKCCDSLVASVRRRWASATMVVWFVDSSGTADVFLFGHLKGDLPLPLGEAGMSQSGGVFVMVEVDGGACSVAGASCSPFCLTMVSGVNPETAHDLGMCHSVPRQFQKTLKTI